MVVAYDEYYKTANLFGHAFPELIDYFKKINKTGKLLDLGCGQGRDAIPLARLGFQVTGIDHSKLGVDQMNAVAQTEQLILKGYVSDMFTYEGFEEFDYILLDSMFHFAKKDQKKEVAFINRLLIQMKPAALAIFCIQHTGVKINVLKNIIGDYPTLEIIEEIRLTYEFSESNHKSKTNYKIIVIRKN